MENKVLCYVQIDDDDDERDILEMNVYTKILFLSIKPISTRFLVLRCAITCTIEIISTFLTLEETSKHTLDTVALVATHFVPLTHAWLPVCPLPAH